MATHFTTTNITAADPPAPSLNEVIWEMQDPNDWSSQMTPAPRTPNETGSAGPRPSVGLAFPR